MKDFPGTPGTLTGLLLRISQCVFAAGSIASMATTASFFNFTAFCYLIASMGLQVIWSLVLALLDAYSLVKKKVLHNPVLVSLFVVGDWVTATLSLAAASASAGITVLYFSDLSHCDFGEECQKYQMAVALAYLSWVCVFVECGVGIGLQQIKPCVSFKAVFSEIDGPSYCGISGSKQGCKRSVSVYQQK